MLHGASPCEAVSARGPIAIRYRSPLLIFFLKSMISPDPKITSFFLEFAETAEFLYDPSTRHSFVAMSIENTVGHDRIINFASI
jgi:hypothetical protein